MAEDGANEYESMEYGTGIFVPKASRTAAVCQQLRLPWKWWSSSERVPVIESA